MGRLFSPRDLTYITNSEDYDNYKGILIKNTEGKRITEVCNLDTLIRKYDIYITGADVKLDYFIFF